MKCRLLLIAAFAAALPMACGLARAATIFFDSGLGGDRTDFVSQTGATLLESFEAESTGSLPLSPGTVTTAGGLLMETTSTSTNATPWRIQDGGTFYGATVPDGVQALVWNYDRSIGGNHTTTITFPQRVSGFGFDYSDIGDAGGSDFTITASDGTQVYQYQQATDGAFSTNTNRFIGVYDDTGAPRFSGYTIEFSTVANDNHFMDAIHTSAAASPQLLGHWKMDEGSGQDVTDSANSYHGTRGDDNTSEPDDPAWNGSGKIGTDALRFDGNDIATFGDVLDQGTSDFSVSMWVNADSDAPNNGRLVQKRGTGSFGTQAGWQLVAARGGTNVKIVNTGWDDATPNAMSTSVSNIGAVENWIQLIATFDNTNDKWIFYADGVEVKNVNVSPDLGSVNNDRQLTFGAADEERTQYFKGLLDDVGIFAGALTPAEAMAIYTLGDDADPLGNGADLNYHLGYAQSLFDLYEAGTGSVSIDGLTWITATGLSTDLGELTKMGDFYFLRLDAAGNGLMVVPEPASAVLACLGLVGLALYALRRRKR